VHEKEIAKSRDFPGVNVMIKKKYFAQTWWSSPSLPTKKLFCFVIYFSRLLCKSAYQCIKCLSLCKVCLGETKLYCCIKLT
jgi:hypothetical protein